MDEKDTLVIMRIVNDGWWYDEFEYSSISQCARYISLAGLIILQQILWIILRIDWIEPNYGSNKLCLILWWMEII